MDSHEACDDGNTCVANVLLMCSYLDVRLLCGNGVVDSREACDDGNTLNVDGCSAMCTAEEGFSCKTAASGTTECKVCVCVVSVSVSVSGPVSPW